MRKSLMTALFVSVLGTSLATAGETWTFDISTSGQDVSWLSPTSIDPSASVFTSSYEVTLVEVDVKWSGITFNNLDVTNQVPPEQLAAGGQLLRRNLVGDIEVVEGDAAPLDVDLDQRDFVAGGEDRR